MSEGGGVSASGGWGARQNELLTTVCAEDFRKLLKIALEFEESQQAGNASAGGKSIGSPRDETVFYPTSLFFLTGNCKNKTPGVFLQKVRQVVFILVAYFKHRGKML